MEEKTILGYILGFTFSFVTIFEGMYVLSKVYPQLFRPLPSSVAVVDSLKIEEDTTGIIWEDTTSIGLEYVEAYKLDSLNKELDKVLIELKKYKDSVVVLYRQIQQVKMELQKRDAMIEKLQAKLNESKADRAKAIAKIYEAMEPRAAAKILENMPDDEALEIILNMQRRQAAKILAELNAKKAMKLTSSGK